MERTRAGISAQGCGERQAHGTQESTDGVTNSVSELVSGGLQLKDRHQRVPNVATGDRSAKGSRHRDSQHHILSTYGSWSERDPRMM